MGKREKVNRIAGYYPTEAGKRLLKMLEPTSLEKAFVQVLRNEKRLAKEDVKYWQTMNNKDTQNFYEGWVRCCEFLLDQLKDNCRQYLADLKKAKQK